MTFWQGPGHLLSRPGLELYQESELVFSWIPKDLLYTSVNVSLELVEGIAPEIRWRCRFLCLVLQNKVSDFPICGIVIIGPDHVVVIYFHRRIATASGMPDSNNTQKHIY